MYTLTLPSKSLSDHQYRNKVWLFLSELTEVIDATSNVDVQVAGVNVTLTAPVDSLSELAAKAQAAGVSFTAEAEDF